ncbi:HAD family hydrolase [Desulfosediminicola flagellatus]|uniref:HAD family hydrolase n=1 Tax=Desulfosediminicola flagellatus TaxID=2569541 RepID=UPI0010AD2576|nr:HAD family phosphatase [Desulfosediminicola flagellatus]
MIRALIFDMDGTLVDSEILHYEAWKETLHFYGVESFSFEDFAAYIGVSNEKLAEDHINKHALSTNVSELLKIKQRLYLQRIPRIEILPGVREILSRYHNQYFLAIASSSDTIELQAILDTLHLAHYFDHVVGGNDVIRKKPDPEIYLHTSELLGVAPRECVVFEDSEPGILAAKAAGMIGIAIPNNKLTGSDYTKADTIISRIDLADDTLLSEITGPNAF